MRASNIRALDPVQEIKTRLNIEDVVAEYFPLKKSGKYLKATCPFHQEKTPSFFVNPERQIAYCFSCHKGGDLFEFIQEIEGLSFREALQLMAEKAGIDLPKHSGTPNASKDEKARLLAAVADANNFFIQNLWSGEDAKKVLSYLHSRGFMDESIKHFQVGLAPDCRDGLYKYLLDRQHRKEDILKSTVVLARDMASEEVRDRFRLRLMLPIQDSQGRIVAFGGRALKKGDQPKYLNSPEYLLYNKSAILYNLAAAKAAIRELQFVVVVEGYFDVMASYQAGVKNVVASCGTALTTEQFKLMKRYCKKIFLAFDSDSAGEAALRRAVEVAQPMDLELFVVQIPQGKDAADAVKEDPAVWRKAVDEALPYLQFYFDFYALKYDLTSASGKKDYADAIVELLSAVKHPVEIDHYLKLLAQKVDVPLKSLYEHLSSYKKKTPRLKSGTCTSKNNTDLKYRSALQLILLMLVYPDVFFDLWKEFESFTAFSSAIKALPLKARFDLITEEKYKDFYENFQSALNSEYPGEWKNLSSIYKHIGTYYNHRGQLDSEFFHQIEEGEKLNKLAFEMELNTNGEAWVREEFKKILARLYFLHST